ncbi:MAG TPA: WG repeat-containing protein, partial [Catalimonadaceae bacterium]|nr:WG repeat-containing protein [Catalimonadaceae bacterium]
MKTTRSTSPLSFWLAIVGLSLCFSFPSVSQTFDCEEELFSKKDKKTRLFGYVNMLGEYRVPPTFLKAMPFSGKYAVVQQGKKFGVINCEGILVVPADYDEIASFINGKGWMKTNNLWGLVDFKGKILIQPTYEEVQEINTFNGTVTWVKKGGLWGLISRETGRMLVAPSYEAISTLSDSAGIGRKNGLQDLGYY